MVEQPNRYRSYEPDIDDAEQDIAAASFRPRPYAFGRTAQQDDYQSQDSVPLFLSDPDSEPDPAEFDYDMHLRVPRRFSISAKILMATVAASSVAVMFAWFSSDAMRDVLISAKASIATVLPVPSAAAQADAPAPTQQLTQRDVQLKDPSRPSGSYNQSAGANPIPQQQVAMLPSREEISSAYQAALQSRAPAPVAAPQAATPPLAAVSPVAVVPPAPAPAPAVPRMDPDELATLMQRAKGFLDTGDLPSARLLLERAAEAKDVNATLLLAQTYDPDVLGTSDVRNIVPEPAKARAWYQKAAQLGSADAQRRLAQLAN
ncbi:MAG TPA: hypothetical protein VKR55_04915 [Bradyrhizobium sp.]|uniref:hypothetical protein n=1 Tax=Bradyrhizobium sp. TaxID=376 RepID=UPI002C267F0D|nr:hypothetical protein [Bradyrhizobium sp.]HLZ01477.1 hypothetical protein [Bradyrhizobium sp.]